MKKNKELIIAITGLLVVIALFITSMFMLFNNKEDKKENDKSNENKPNNDLIIPDKQDKNQFSKTINDKYKIISMHNKTDNEEKTNYYKLLKIVDLNNKTLYEGDILYNKIHEGIDKNIYISSINSNNELVISKLENKKFITYSNLGTKKDFEPLVFYTEKDPSLSSVLNPGIDEETKLYLIGYGNNIFDNEKSIFYNNYISIVTKTNTNANFVGSYKRTTPNSSIITYNDNEIIVSKTNNNPDDKYGVYNIKEDKVTVDFLYDKLVYFNNRYIAIKDNKYGLIDNNNNVLLDFEYDFIAPNEEAYILCKNGKMALMDKDLNIFTNFVFDYQESNLNIEYEYGKCCGGFNTFFLFKYNDYYFLNNSVGAGTSYGDNKILTYPKNQEFVISKDGTYKTYINTSFDVENHQLYSYNSDTKIYTFYDENVKEKFNIEYKSGTLKILPNGNIYLNNNLYNNKNGKIIKENVKYEDIK